MKRIKNIFIFQDIDPDRQDADGDDKEVSDIFFLI